MQNISNQLFAMLILVIGSGYSFAGTSASVTRSTLARPVDLLLTSDGRRLLACNQRSGSITFIDTTSMSVVTDVAVGQNPSAFTWIDDSRLAVVDQSQHDVSIFDVMNDSLSEVSRVSVSQSPVDVMLSSDGNKLFVTSLWSHRWTSFGLGNSLPPKVLHQVDLPFAPRHQLQFDDRYVFVTDAFGGKWLLLDCKKGRIVRSGEFVGTHNITGIAKSTDGKNLFVPHMTLNDQKPTTEFNVHWGDVMLNVVRSIAIDDLVDVRKSLSGPYAFLGYPDAATGDPTGILLTKEGRQIVCFAGVGEVGISDAGVNTFDRIKVGRRPISMVLNDDETKLFVANKLDDTISVIDVSSKKVISTIGLSSTNALSLADHGEQLFYDSRLSSDGWFSCHSCHTDGHSNGGLADTFGDGQAGDAKRVQSLLGVVDTGPWAWNGKSESIEKQIHASIVTTMRGPTPSKNQVDAILVFISGLRPPPSVQQSRGAIDDARIIAGEKIFQTQGCANCHSPGTYTSADAFDVGLKDHVGNSEFNPPSLRGVSQRPRLFHDNRAESVHDVLTRCKHQLDGHLTESEVGDLAAFVLSL